MKRVEDSFKPWSRIIFDSHNFRVKWKKHNIKVQVPQETLAPKFIFPQVSLQKSLMSKIKHGCTWL